MLEDTNSLDGALLILQKKSFEKLDKAKDFRSLKFSICLNQREIIYLMADKDIDFKAYFQIQMKTFYVFIASPIRQLMISHKNLICACAFAKFAE